MVEDRLVLLVEAQSTWTENIVVRSLLYLAQTYQDYLQDRNHPQSVYSTKKINIPRPEFYMIYTGESPKQKKILSLQEEFFDGQESGLEVKVKVLYDGQDGDILYQYVAFTKVVNEVVQRSGRTQSAAEEIIRICKSRDILKEYLESREKEVFDIMIELFNDEQIQKSYMESERFKAKTEGRMEERTELVKKLLKGGIGTVNDIAKLTDLPVETVKSIAAGAN